MFLTANTVVAQYGIDEAIAKFYVDREPPKENLYWKDKLLYLRPAPGYIFLPLITDLFYKSGISKHILLSEMFIQLLEQIGHYSAEEELQLITADEALQKCIDHVEPIATNKIFLGLLEDHFNGKKNFITDRTTPFAALHRGDLFLFSLCLFDVTMAAQENLISIWFALISTLLLLDDAEDIEADKEINEQNAFLESGSNKDGFKKIQELVTNNLNYLATINPILTNTLRQKFIIATDKPFIKEYINA
jgi:hypothetical protein